MAHMSTSRGEPARQSKLQRPEHGGMTRRRFGQGAVVAAGLWVTPSVVGLDRVAAAAPSVPYSVFYQENFQGAIGNANAAWSTTMTDVPPADANRRFLGQFNNDNVTLNLGGLPLHDCLCVEFEFFQIQSWDGEHPSNGPDVLNVLVDGVNLFSESFAHDGQSAGQTFGPAANNPPGTGASEFGTLGYTFFGDGVYNLSICDIVHTATTATITFSVSGLQSINDESWGLNNVVISTA